MSSPKISIGSKVFGGEGGIRTRDTLASMPHFECGAFNHSATSPQGAALASRLVAWAAATRKQSKGCAHGSNCQVAPASPPAPGTFHAVFLPTIAATL